MRFYQEAVPFTTGVNFQPVTQKLKSPAAEKGISMFLLSGSYEYDLEMIKTFPQPRMNFKHVLLPTRVTGKLNNKVFKFIKQPSQLNDKYAHLQAMKVTPRLIPIKYPFPTTIKENVFIPFSEFVEFVNPYIRGFAQEYVKNNIFDIFKWVMDHFKFSNERIIKINTSKYKIYSDLSPATFRTDLINSLLTAYIMIPPDKIPSIPITLVFENPKADYKFNLAKFAKTDVPKMRAMLSKIGTPSGLAPEGEVADSADDFDKDKSPEVENIEAQGSTPEKNLQTKIKALKAKSAGDDTPVVVEKKRDTLYKAKTQNINAQLLRRISLDTKTVANYKKIAAEIAPEGEDTPVENTLREKTARQLATMVEPVDITSAMNTVSSPREEKIRAQVGQVKLGDTDFKTMVSVTDRPLPPATKPMRLTTTNPGALQGSRFARFGEAYETQLLERDIVATFMNLSELPHGFYVTGVEVTDISTPLAATDNWRIKLKNKQSDTATVINVKVPKIKNNRFYEGGIWYSIQKQDYPIPVMKVGKKKVICTASSKMTVNRYDTKSLVDIGLFVKTMNSVDPNPYITVGQNTSVNSRFVSTIEYDEYAKQYFSFVNPEKHVEIFFNRPKCLEKYNFVGTSETEFCCGMVGKVPIIVNTDTGLTRQGKTLTGLMIETLPEHLQKAYAGGKPGKLSMYSEVYILGIKVPVGVAIAAWEGMTSLIAKAGTEAKYVGKDFKDPNYFIIPFKDRGLAIPNTVQNQLLFNGFYRINTKNHDISEFENPIMNQDSIFVDIFQQQFFKQYSQLTTFINQYYFFLDAITKDVCLHYNIPDNISGMLVYASNLLADNNYASENHSSLYRIRSSEVVPAIIHEQLGHAVAKYNNKVGSKHKGAPFMFNPNCVIENLRKIPTVGPVSALNPIIELHSQENISQSGFHGLNDDRSYSLEKRTFDNSMIGKMAISSPNNKNVGVTRQLTADPKIESLRGYTSTKPGDDEYNDLQLASFSELLTPNTVTRDDSIRTAIATSQSAHIVYTEDAQPVLINNGVDELVPSYMSEEFTYVAPQNGAVIDMNDDYMIVRFADETIKAINIGDKCSFNTGGGFYVNNKLQANFQLGEKFKEGDILAYHPKHFSKDASGMVRANIGPMLNVAFMGLYSTYEDAGAITASASKRLATNLIMMQDQQLDATEDIEFLVKVGTEVEIGDPLIKFGLGDTGDKSTDKFLRSFAEDKEEALDAARRVVSSDYAGTVVDVRMYTVKSMDKLSPSLFEIFNEYFKANRQKRKILDKHDKSQTTYKLDTLYTLPVAPLKASSIKGRTCDVMIEIYIAHDDEASVGDKLALYGPSKQILSEKIPEGLEPYAESTPQEEISLFLAPSSVLKRMIPSTVINASGNKVLFALKDRVKQIWNA